MAKYTTKTVGVIYKKANGQAESIYVKEDITLKKGDYLNLENEKTQLASIERAVSEGKLKEDYAEERKASITEYWNQERTNKDGETYTMKDLVRFNVVKVSKS